MLIHHILLFGAIHTTHDIIKAKPELVLHIVGGVVLLTVVCWSKGAMFANSDFGIAQSPCN